MVVGDATSDAKLFDVRCEVLGRGTMSKCAVAMACNDDGDVGAWIWILERDL